ncbi:sigma factor regulator N-terminal domain-containing protein [Sporosarcina thermotolerans]|uniref:Sigma factor regulator N-terminal domain-containing protein n=1 Tax=Sporosarcina thermotolerans TaxID=633404 RepID=A0AAW9ADZ4_9BACL|nr:sigma factor regulator N-terminal domain-containing protein [Sporosarcina thermotolerans]MDW0118315.1 sigma factor regulator N-terminal domain-containing protein [Sporosarcina thermotolerans]WHT48620.1 sigma factor regulator N-terminal domain-containing protein [Sporosarcina thermotolerans]
MDQSLKNALKKAKRRQYLKIVIISLAVVLISLPILYKTGNYFAAKGSTSLHKQLFLHNAIAEPNIRIDSQVTSNRSMFGGNIVTNRSKNINGYLVQWSTLTSSYGWLRNDIDHNELIPGFFWSDKEFYEYDKQTKNKVATFYHPAIQQYHVVENKLNEISQVKNQVAEVAVSFDQPYTWQEIQGKIPENLNIVWLYMASQIGDESNGPAGMPVYGFSPSNSTMDAYDNFIASLEVYDSKGYNEVIQEFLKENKDKKFKDVKILGVMLTGRTQSFKALVNEDFIRGASVGATAEIVPYIEPEK